MVTESRSSRILRPPPLGSWGGAFAGVLNGKGGRTEQVGQNSFKLTYNISMSDFERS